MVLLKASKHDWSYKVTSVFHIQSSSCHGHKLVYFWRGPSRCHEVLVPFLGPKIRPRNLIGLPPCILTRYQRTRNLQETRKPPTGDWQETFRKPSRNGKPTGRPRETDRKPTGNLQETRRKHAGNLQETCRKLAGIPRETCRKPARNLQETRRKPTARKTIYQE